MDRTGCIVFRERSNSILRAATRSRDSGLRPEKWPAITAPVRWSGEPPHWFGAQRASAGSVTSAVTIGRNAAAQVRHWRLASAPFRRECAFALLARILLTVALMLRGDQTGPGGR